MLRVAGSPKIIKNTKILVIEIKTATSFNKCVFFKEEAEKIEAFKQELLAKKTD